MTTEQDFVNDSFQGCEGKILEAIRLLGLDPGTEATRKEALGELDLALADLNAGWTRFHEAEQARETGGTAPATDSLPANVREIVRLAVEQTVEQVQAENHEKIARQRAALEIAGECFKELGKRHTDEATADDLRVALDCIERGLLDKNEFDPLGYHTRGLLNFFQGSPRSEAGQILDAIEDIFHKSSRWDLAGELEKRATTSCGSYPVEGNWLIEMRDHICEILQFLPSLEGGDGQVDQWVQDAAVKLHACIHHSLPKELRHCTVEEWMDRNSDDLDDSDNESADSAQEAENGQVRNGAAE